MVVNCSGVFRDLFVNQMILLDRAVKLAADQDEPLEMNFVRKHAMAQARSDAGTQSPQSLLLLGWTLPVSASHMTHAWHSFRLKP